MKSIKFLLCALMSISFATQAADNDRYFGLKTAAVITGAAITGVAVWRMTAPSDAKVLEDLNNSSAAPIIRKYKQSFDTTDKHGQQEEKLTENLITKLRYKEFNEFPDKDVVQNELRQDATALKKAKSDIWFRSFFSEIVADTYENIHKAELNATKLQPYFKKHEDFFVGNILYRDLYHFQQQRDNFANRNAFLESIQKHYILSKAYPILYVVEKLTKDLNWIEKLQGTVYPILKNNLEAWKALSLGIIIELQFGRDEQGICEYDVEMSRKLQEEENNRQNELVRIEALKANAQLINAELSRMGYTQQEVQRQLNNEGFTRAVIGLFFGSSY